MNAQNLASSPDGEDWRSLLPQLRGLPLIGCKGKRPINAVWQHSSATPAQIAQLGNRITGVGTRTGPDAGGLLAFDLDGRRAITMALEHGCNPDHADTWQIWRQEDPHRLKVLWRVPPDLWPVLGHIHTNQPLKPPVKDDDGRLLTKGDGIELYFGSGQILLLGLHPESGGQYRWRGSPAALEAIPPLWWELALELSDHAPRQQQGHASRSATGSGDWRRLRLCPICGRSERSVCQQHRDEETIRCFHGATFHPPTDLAAGQLIPGKPWAFCRVQTVSWAQFSIFRRHRPRAVTLARTWRVEGGRRG